MGGYRRVLGGVESGGGRGECGKWRGMRRVLGEVVMHVRGSSHMHHLHTLPFFHLISSSGERKPFHCNPTCVPVSFCRCAGRGHWPGHLHGHDAVGDVPVGGAAVGGGGEPDDLGGAGAGVQQTGARGRPGDRGRLVVRGKFNMKYNNSRDVYLYIYSLTWDR